MAFNVTTNTRKESTNYKEVDWDALRAHTIEAAKTQTKARSLPGVISSVIDMGIQQRPDYQEQFNGTEADERQAVAENDKVYFKTEGGKRYKYTPLADAQSVAITVDFPQILVDKGQFFGNSKPLPLRLVLNGEVPLSFITGNEDDKSTRVLAKGFTLTEVKHPNNKWGFDKKNTLWKIADAAGLVGEDGIFKPQDIDKLLGAVVQFTVRVYNKPSAKDPSKSFYTEEIKFNGMTPEGITVPVYDAGILHMVQFSKQNKPEDLKQLRASVINTIKRATNFSSSVLATQLQTTSQAPSATPQGKVENVSKSVPEAPVSNEIDFDSDVPF